CHCADSETNAYARIRFLVAEKSPNIQGYDQNTWARVFAYHDLPLEPALAVVEAVRATTAALIRRLADEAWARAGTHTQWRRRGRAGGGGGGGGGRRGGGVWISLPRPHRDTRAREKKKKGGGGK